MRKFLNGGYPAFFRNFIFPVYEKISSQRNVSLYLQEYERSINSHLDALMAKQAVACKNILVHAFNTVPYYKGEWRSIGFDPNKFSDISELQQLPVLTKSIITDRYEDFVSSRHKENNIKKSTGGSTGQPFRFELDYQSQERRQAVMWRGYGWLGAKLGVSSTYLWGGPLGAQSFVGKLKENLYHRFYNRVMLDSFFLSEQNVHQYVDALNKRKSDVIVAYVNPIVTLAKYILDNNIAVYSPKAILTGAEPLYGFQRELIECAFQAPVYNTYGCREFMLIGAECEKQDGFHTNIDHLVVEVVDEQGHSASSGDVVITDLYNYGFPLIRYQNGDRATRSDAACSCGNPLPLLKSVDGRKLDLIETFDGRKIPGEFFPHLLKDYRSVQQFQVVQKNLKGVEIKIVVSAGGYNDQQFGDIRAKILEVAGSSFYVDIEIVEDIPLTVSGKHRVVVNLIDKGE